MADVTFGVKVSEEMKGELSELMKSTSLTGKEFMNLLIHTYKLEKERSSDSLIRSDIEELQRLLQRIQHLYINMNERTGLLVEDRLREQTQVIESKEQAIAEVEARCTTYIAEKETYQKEIETLHAKIVDKDNEIKRLEEKIKEHKMQIKQQILLEEKYELQVAQLHEKVESYQRFEVEVTTLNEELTTFKNRNDEMASEIWFMQREAEKLQKEHQTQLQQQETTLETLKNHYSLEQKNVLLEQKIQFNQKMDILKEEHFKVQEGLHQQIQEILRKKE